MKKKLCYLTNNFHRRLGEDFGPEVMEDLLSDMVDTDREVVSDMEYRALHRRISNYTLTSEEFRKRSIEYLFNDEYIRDILEEHTGKEGAAEVLKSAMAGTDTEQVLNMYERILDMKTGVRDKKGRLWLSGGDLLLDSKKSALNYILNNRYDRYRRGSLFHFFETFGINEEVGSLERSLGSVLPGTEDSIIGKYQLLSMEEHEALEEKMKLFSGITGASVHVLSPEDYVARFTEVLTARKPAGVSQNIEDTVTFLKDKPAFYYTDEGGNKYIYFNREMLSYDTMSHEFMHLVVDLIEAEDPKLYEELENYLMIHYADAFREMVRFYGTREIYDGKTVHKEIVTDLLSKMISLEAVPETAKGLLERVMEFLKRVVLYFLGMDYHHPNGRLMAHLLNDDIFLGKSVRRINEILSKEGVFTERVTGKGSYLFFNTIVTDHLSLLNSRSKVLSDLMKRMSNRSSIALTLSIIEKLEKDTLEEKATNAESALARIAETVKSCRAVTQNINNVYKANLVGNHLFAASYAVADGMLHESPVLLKDRIETAKERIQWLMGKYRGALKSKENKLLLMMRDSFYDDLNRLIWKYNTRTLKDLNDAILQIKQRNEFKKMWEDYKNREKDKDKHKASIFFSQTDVEKLVYRAVFMRVFNTIIRYYFLRELRNLSPVKDNYFDDVVVKGIREELLNQNLDIFAELKSVMMSVLPDMGDILNERQNEIKNYLENLKIEDAIERLMTLSGISLHDNTRTGVALALSINLSNPVRYVAGRIMARLFGSSYKHGSTTYMNFTQQVYNSLFYLFSYDDSRVYELNLVMEAQVEAAGKFKYRMEEKNVEAILNLYQTSPSGVHTEDTLYREVPFIIRLFTAPNTDMVITGVDAVDGYHLGYLSAIYLAVGNVTEYLKKIEKTIDPRLDLLKNEITRDVQTISEDSLYFVLFFKIGLLKKLRVVPDPSFKDVTGTVRDDVYSLWLIDTLYRYGESTNMCFDEREAGNNPRALTLYIITSLFYHYHLLKSKNPRTDFRDILNEFIVRLVKYTYQYNDYILDVFRSGHFYKDSSFLSKQKGLVDLVLRDMFDDNGSFSKLYQQAIADNSRWVMENLSDVFPDEFQGLLSHGIFREMARRIYPNISEHEISNLISAFVTELGGGLASYKTKSKDGLYSFLKNIKPFSDAIFFDLIRNEEGKQSTLQYELSLILRDPSRLNDFISFNKDIPTLQHVIDIFIQASLSQQKAEETLSMLLKGFSEDFGEVSDAEHVIDTHTVNGLISQIEYSRNTDFFNTLLNGTVDEIADIRSFGGPERVEINKTLTHRKAVPTRMNRIMLDFSVLLVTQGKNRQPVLKYETITYSLSDQIHKFDNPNRFIHSLYESEIQRGFNTVFGFLNQGEAVTTDFKELSSIIKTFMNTDRPATLYDFVRLLNDILELLKSRDDVFLTLRDHLVFHFTNYLNLRKYQSLLGDEFSEVAAREVPITEHLLSKLKNLSSNKDAYQVGTLLFYYLFYFNEFVKRNNPIKSIFNIGLSNVELEESLKGDRFSVLSGSSNAFKNAARFYGLVTGEDNRNLLLSMAEGHSVLSTTGVPIEFKPTSPDMVFFTSALERLQSESAEVHNKYHELYNRTLSAETKQVFRLLRQRFKLKYDKMFSRSHNGRRYVKLLGDVHNANFSGASVGEDTIRTLTDIEKIFDVYFDFNSDAYTLYELDGIPGRYTVREVYFHENESALNRFRDYIRQQADTLFRRTVFRSIIEQIHARVEEALRSSGVVPEKTVTGKAARPNIVDQQHKLFYHLHRLSLLLGKEGEIPEQNFPEILTFLFIGNRDFYLSLTEILKAEGESAGPNVKRAVKDIMVLSSLAGGFLRSYLLSIRSDEDIRMLTGGYRYMNRYKQNERMYRLEFEPPKDEQAYRKKSIGQMTDAMLVYPSLSHATAIRIIDQGVLSALHQLYINNPVLQEHEILTEYDGKTGTMKLLTNKEPEKAEVHIDFYWYQKMISDFGGFLFQLTEDIGEGDAKTDLIRSFLKNVMGFINARTTEIDSIRTYIDSGNHLFRNTVSDIFYGHKNILGVIDAAESNSIFNIVLSQYEKAYPSTYFFNVYSPFQRVMAESRMGDAQRSGKYPYFGNHETGRNFRKLQIRDTLRNLFAETEDPDSILEGTKYGLQVSNFTGYRDELNKRSTFRKYGINDTDVEDIKDRLVLFIRLFLQRYFFKEGEVESKFSIYKKRAGTKTDEPYYSLFSFVEKLEDEDGKRLDDRIKELIDLLRKVLVTSNTSGRSFSFYLSRSNVTAEVYQLRDSLRELFWFSNVDSDILFNLYFFLESYYQGGYRAFVKEAGKKVEEALKEKEGEGKEPLPVKEIIKLRYNVYLDMINGLISGVSGSINIEPGKGLPEEEVAELDFLLSRMDMEGEKKNQLLLLLYFNLISGKHSFVNKTRIIYDATTPKAEERIIKDEREYVFHDVFKNYVTQLHEPEDIRAFMSGLSSLYVKYVATGKIQFVPFVQHDSLLFAVLEMIGKLSEIDIQVAKISQKPQNPLEILYGYYNTGKNETIMKSLTGSAFVNLLDDLSLRMDGGVLNEDLILNHFFDWLPHDLGIGLDELTEDLADEDDVVFNLVFSDIIEKDNITGSNLIEDMLAGDEDLVLNMYDLYNYLLDLVYQRNVSDVLQDERDYWVYKSLQEDETARRRVPLLADVSFSYEEQDMGYKGEIIPEGRKKAYFNVFNIDHHARKMNNANDSGESDRLHYRLTTVLWSSMISFMVDSYRMAGDLLRKILRKRKPGEDETVAGEELRERDLPLLPAGTVSPEIKLRAEKNESISRLHLFLTGNIDVFSLLHGYLSAKSRENVISASNPFIYRFMENAGKSIFERIVMFGENILSQMDRIEHSNLARKLADFIYIVAISFIFIRNMDTFVAIPMYLGIAGILGFLSSFLYSHSASLAFWSTLNYIKDLITSVLLFLVGMLPARISQKIYSSHNPYLRFIADNVLINKRLGRTAIGLFNNTVYGTRVSRLAQLSGLLRPLSMLISNPIFIKDYMETTMSSLISGSIINEMPLKTKAGGVILFKNVFRLKTIDNVVYLSLVDTYDIYYDNLRPEVKNIVDRILKSGEQRSIPLNTIFGTTFFRFMSNYLFQTSNMLVNYTSLRVPIFAPIYHSVKLFVLFFHLMVNSLGLVMRTVKNIFRKHYGTVYSMAAVGLSLFNIVDPDQIPLMIHNVLNSGIYHHPMLKIMYDVIPREVNDISDFFGMLWNSLFASPINVMFGIMVTGAYHILAVLWRNFIKGGFGGIVFTDVLARNFRIFLYTALTVLTLNITSTWITNQKLERRADPVAYRVLFDPLTYIEGAYEGYDPRYVMKRDHTGYLLGIDLLNMTRYMEKMNFNPEVAIDTELMGNLVDYLYSVKKYVDAYPDPELTGPASDMVFDKAATVADHSGLNLTLDDASNIMGTADYSSETFRRLSALPNRFAVHGRNYFLTHTHIFLRGVEFVRDEVNKEVKERPYQGRDALKNRIESNLLSYMEREYERTFHDQQLIKLNAAFVTHILTSNLLNHLMKSYTPGLDKENKAEGYISYVDDVASKYHAYAFETLTTLANNTFVRMITSSEAYTAYAFGENWIVPGSMRKPSASEEYVESLKENIYRLRELNDKYGPWIERMYNAMISGEPWAANVDMVYSFLKEVLPEYTRYDKSLQHMLNYRSPSDIAMHFQFTQFGPLFSKGFTDIFLSSLLTPKKAEKAIKGPYGKVKEQAVVSPVTGYAEVSSEQVALLNMYNEMTPMLRLYLVNLLKNNFENLTTSPFLSMHPWRPVRGKTVFDVLGKEYSELFKFEEPVK